MTIAYFLEVHNKEAGIRFEQKQLAGLKARLPTLPHITGLSIYTPVKENNCSLLIQVLLEGELCLTRMLATSEYDTIRSQLNTLMTADAVLTQQAMLLETFLSPGKGTQHNSIAHLAIYHGPVQDEKQFTLDYRNHQAPALLQLPGIKRLEIGLPVPYQYPPAIARAERILFCESDFDNLEQLNTALASEIHAGLQKNAVPVKELVMQREILVY